MNTNMFICNIFIHEYKYFHNVLINFIRIKITQQLILFYYFLFYDFNVDFHEFESIKYDVYN